ncbi:serine hydrolase [Nocardioides sp. TF02-7]|uniref:serine hydrolase n=1 Tax=Nocardioides sp. TF02-7 TaxID=2917724 RepID=UPI001F06D734|nr:serine hydrolase [Nocardioides sp. TF02-7]UMG94518.1 serine hydrolase [Nocardioides sp. TF02-7]
MEYDDRSALLTMLAGAEPEFAPGAAVAEHALTYGHLCGAVVEAATAERLEERFDDLAARFGWDLHLAVAPAQQHRVADVVAADAVWPRDLLDDPRWGPAIGRPPGLLDPTVLNSARWRRTPFEAISLHATAEGIARFQADATTPDGPVARLLGPDLHAAYVGPAVTGHDLVLDRDVTWTLGFQLDSDGIGMGGAGGAVGWTSSEHGYSAGYVTRGLGDHARADEVFDAIDAALSGS